MDQIEDIITMKHKIDKNINKNDDNQMKKQILIDDEGYSKNDEQKEQEQEQDQDQHQEKDQNEEQEETRDEELKQLKTDDEGYNKNDEQEDKEQDQEKDQNEEQEEMRDEELKNLKDLCIPSSIVNYHQKLIVSEEKIVEDDNDVDDDDANNNDNDMKYDTNDMKKNKTNNTSSNENKQHGNSNNDNGITVEYRKNNTKKVRNSFPVGGAQWSFNPYRRWRRRFFVDVNGSIPSCNIDEIKRRSWEGSTSGGDNIPYFFNPPRCGYGGIKKIGEDYFKDDGGLLKELEDQDEDQDDAWNCHSRFYPEWSGGEDESLSRIAMEEHGKIKKGRYSKRKRKDSDGGGSYEHNKKSRIKDNVGRSRNDLIDDALFYSSSSSSSSSSDEDDIDYNVVAKKLRIERRARWRWRENEKRKIRKKRHDLVRPSSLKGVTRRCGKNQRQSYPMCSPPPPRTAIECRARYLCHHYYHHHPNSGSSSGRGSNVKRKNIPFSQEESNIVMEYVRKNQDEMSSNNCTDTIIDGYGVSWDDVASNLNERAKRKKILDERKNNVQQMKIVVQHRSPLDCLRHFRIDLFDGKKYPRMTQEKEIVTQKFVEHNDDDDNDYGSDIDDDDEMTLSNKKKADLTETVNDHHHQSQPWTPLEDELLFKHSMALGCGHTIGPAIDGRSNYGPNSIFDFCERFMPYRTIQSLILRLNYLLRQVKRKKKYDCRGVDGDSWTVDEEKRLFLAMKVYRPDINEDEKVDESETVLVGSNKKSTVKSRGSTSNNSWKYMERGSLGQWQKVKDHFPGRAKICVTNKWYCTLDPRYCRESFTDEEDCDLLQAINDAKERLGEIILRKGHWLRTVAKLFPHRHPKNLYHRYKVLIIRKSSASTAPNEEAEEAEEAEEWLGIETDVMNI